MNAYIPTPFIRSPHDVISIAWEVGNASGSTEVEAWIGQDIIDQLQAAGYTITGVTLV